MGQLGWTPHTLLTSTPEQFYYACQGYFAKLERDEQVARMASWRIHQSLVPKALSIDKFWPIGKPVEVAKKEFSKDWWDAVREKHKQIDAQIKSKQV